MVTTRNQANAPIAPCMFWRRIHRGCIMNVTEYVGKEYDDAQLLYKSLSTIKALVPSKKKELLSMIDKQLELIDNLDEECGTPLEERRLAFITKVLAAARRSCLE